MRGYVVIAGAFALLVSGVLGVGAATAAGATAKRDMTRVDIEWMVTASGSQEFSWTASADGGQPQCGDSGGERKVRTVAGSGSFSLPFSTPRAYRIDTIQVVTRAGKRQGFRSLSYRPRGVPKIEAGVQLPVTPTITGSFTDQILACDAFDASTQTADASACGSRPSILSLGFGFGITGQTTRIDPGLTGTLVKPWFIDNDGKNLCPTYESVATSYFNGGRGTGACPDLGALDPGGSDRPEMGLAKFFTKGKYTPALLAAHPKAFTLTVNKPMDCTLTPSDSYLPVVAPSGSLHITGSFHYTWAFTPKKVTGAAGRSKPL